MFQQQNQQYNLYSTGGGAQGGGDSNNNMFFQRLSNNVNPMSSPTSNVVVSNSNRGDGGAVNMDHGRFFPNTSSSSWLMNLNLNLIKEEDEEIKHFIILQ